MEAEITNYWDNMSYESVKNTIHNNLRNIKQSYVAIGFYLRVVKERELYLQDGYNDLWTFAKEEYGISMSTASRWISINEKFSKDGNTPYLAEEYRGYGKSQLQEMLYLNDEQMQQVSPDMTKQQIRDIRKPEKKEDVVSEVVEEQIPGQYSFMNHPEILPPDPPVAPAQEKPEVTFYECFCDFYNSLVPEDVKKWATDGNSKKVTSWINDNKIIPYTETVYGWIHGNTVKLVFEDQYKNVLYTQNWYSIKELIMKKAKEDAEKAELEHRFVEDPQEHVCDTCKNASPITGNAAKCDECQASGEDYEAFDQKEPLIDRAKLIDAIKNYFKDCIENDVEADIYEINADIMEIIEKL